MRKKKQGSIEIEKMERPEWQIFRLRLGELMLGASNREIGAIAGAAESTIHHWLNSGRIPKEMYLRRLEAHFGKPEGWLLGDKRVRELEEREKWKITVRALTQEEMQENPPETMQDSAGINFVPQELERRTPVNRESQVEKVQRRIPVLQVEVGAGGGRLNGDEYVQEYFEVPEGLIPWKGDLSIVSVCGDSMEATYRHGDLVIVQPENRVMDAVMVVAWDDALMVKRVLRVGAKTVKLISDNAAYEPVTIAINEIRVVGRVVGLIRWNA